MKSTALLRRGLIHIANMESSAGMSCMDKAAEVDPTNGDVYHHKGQVCLLVHAGLSVCWSVCLLVCLSVGLYVISMLCRWRY